MSSLMDKIELSRLKIFNTEPFLGYVLQQIDIELVSDIETAATDGRKIIFSKEFLKKLSLQQTMFVLLHELLHIILGHPKRGVNFEDYHRYNIACDIVVNEILKYYGFYSPGLVSIDSSNYYIKSGVDKAVEQVYKDLPSDVNEKTLDIHTGWITDSAVGDEISKIIESAQLAGYSTQINCLLNRVIENPEYGYTSHKWKDLLDKYVIKDIYDYSFNKVDTRYGKVLLPTFIENEESLKSIWFVVDVSGSMNNEDLALMLGEIERIIKHYNNVRCDVSFFSTQTTPPIRFKDKYELQDAFRAIRSTGGTDFKQIFVEMRNYYSEFPNLVVVLTDGFSDYPSKDEISKVPVISGLSTFTIESLIFFSNSLSDRSSFIFNIN